MIEERNDLAHLFPEKQDKYKDCYLSSEVIENLPNGYLSDFKRKLLAHPKYEIIKDDYIIDEERNILIHILDRVPMEEVKDLTNEQHFFYPICGKEEIRRMFNMKTASDYLLRLRAEQVEGNKRLKRVFSSLRKKDISNWSFEKTIDGKLFRKYILFLPQEERKICRRVPHGTIHESEANGYCMKTPFGNIIVLSFALRYFLYYMNLNYFGSQLSIPPQDQFKAFVIATRIMLGTESLDFEIDNRGEIPKDAHKQIDAATEWQMYFIIGHEYAHHYLKHIDSGSAKCLNISKNFIHSNPKFYTYSQQQELDADYYSVMKPEVSDEHRTEIADGAFFFFCWLDLFETVESYLFPQSGTHATHPKPIDRIWELRKRLDSKYGLSEDDIKKILETNNEYKNKLIKEVLPFEVEMFERYGSAYLPSYRSKEMIDRLDF